MHSAHVASNCCSPRSASPAVDCAREAAMKKRGAIKNCAGECRSESIQHRGASIGKELNDEAHKYYSAAKPRESIRQHIG